MAFRIFLSSEMTVLKPFRDALKEAIEGAHPDFKVVGIDFKTQNKVNSTMLECFEILNEADYLLCIIGEKMGSYIEEGFSGTELEFLASASRFNMRKCFVDYFSKNDTNERDEGVLRFLNYLKSHPYLYSKLITGHDLSIIENIVCQVLTDHHLLTKNIQKEKALIPASLLAHNWTHEHTPLGDYTWDSLGSSLFLFHCKMLKEDYILISLQQKIPNMLTKYGYVFEYIKTLILKNGNKMSHIEKDKLNLLGELLEIFAESFIWVYYSSPINVNALWCARTSALLFRITKNYSGLKQVLIREMNIYYGIASKFQTDYRQREQYMSESRLRYLKAALNLSLYLKYVGQRTPGLESSELINVDRGYEPFLLRELGDTRTAAKLHQEYASHQKDSGLFTMYQLGEFTYTLSKLGKDKRFSENLEKVQDYVTKSSISDIDGIVGRRLLQMYLALGESKKGADLYEKLIFKAISNDKKWDIIKLESIYRFAQFG